MSKMKLKWMKRGIAGMLTVSMLTAMTPVTYAKEIQDGTQADEAAAVFTENAIDTGMEGDASANTGTDTIQTDIDASTDICAGSAADIETYNTANSVIDDINSSSDGTFTDDSMVGTPEVVETIDKGTDNGESDLETFGEVTLLLTQNDTGSTLTVEGNNITVTDAKGLIELSNMDVGYYYNKNITITITGSQTIYDLTSENTGEKTFQGFGSTTHPFEGTIVFAQGSEKAIKTKKPLFNAISTKAQIPNFTFKVDGDTADNNVFTDQPLLADTVIGDGISSWVINTQGGDNNGTTNYTIGGVIGTLQSGSVNLTVNNSVTGTLKVTGTNHRGLFCNTMATGTSLTANLAQGEGAGSISINATGVDADAGGFVGKMEDDTTLILSGSAVSTVNSGSGNAGGLVGSATNAMIALAENETYSLSNVTITAGGGKSAGGLVGDYINTLGTADKPRMLDLSSFIFSTDNSTDNPTDNPTDKSVTLSGGDNGGGVFGSLHNNGGVLVISSTSESPTTVTSSSGTTQNYGGLIGQADGVLTATLTIRNLSISSSTTSAPVNYGGVIGSASKVYVEFSDGLDVKPKGDASKQNGVQSNFGGLVGSLEKGGSAFLNIGSVTLTRENIPSANNAIGGLVGALASGVVRLHGTTDLTGMYFDGLKGGGTGQIVGRNTNGLVYAVGTGNAMETDGTGWLLKRPASPASDIGNWGQVIRLDGTNLKETTSNDETNAPNLFYFNIDDHTITVLGEPSNTYIINNVRDFAAYALTYDFGGVNQSALKFSGNQALTVKPNQNQIITIAADIDLTGTGILGIGRDDGKDAGGTGSADTSHFQGEISGLQTIPSTPSPTITLDIGNRVFGDGVTKDTDPVGRGGLQVFNDGHNFLGLLPVAGVTTSISNLTISGKVTGYSNENSGDNSAKRIAGTIGYCKANMTFENVTVSATVTVSGGKTWIYQGGFFGDIVNGNKSITFQDCTWSGTLTNNVSDDTNRYSRVGGFAAYIQKDKKNITVKDCILSGSIARSSASSAHIGGLFADFEGGNAPATLNISNLLVNGETLTATSATTCGGLLGYSWPDTNVTFGTDVSTDENGTSIPAKGGVTISGCNLNAGSGAQFGGLVYQATGYWDATRGNSIVFERSSPNNSFTGRSDKNAVSGLLVGNGLITVNNNTKALYLEVGTWGEATDAAYKIDGAVGLTLNGTEVTSDSSDQVYFDELVGVTINNAKGSNAGNDNAVVSLAVRDNIGQAAAIDPVGVAACNTYTGQIGNYINPNTRYYYNLDSFRTENTTAGNITISATSLSSAEAVVLWSVSQYAASNIRGYFCNNADSAANITYDTNGINLTGYSYYPVTPLKPVTVGSTTDGGGTTDITNLTFGYEDMNGKESSNKLFDDEDHQHYLMQCGLLYNAGNVTVQNTALSGTVGKIVPTKGEPASGALIYGSVSGNVVSGITYTVSLNNVTLAGVRVADVDSDTDYAPLLINKIGEAVTLTVDGLSTGEGYVANSETKYAASSLIGDVGNSKATKLTLSFSNIAVDSRVRASSNTYVYNNGESMNHKVEYHTTHTIFTRATLLNSFQYTSGSTGVYNFNSDDDKVTYGVEISNTTSGRNQGRQYHYFDEITTISWDGVGKRPIENNSETSSETSSETQIKDYYSTGNYLRYVKKAESEENEYKELDINIHVANLLKGCGTYGDPYQITEGAQLVQLASYINGADTGNSNGWVVCVNYTVFESKQQDSTNYHTDTDNSSEDHLYYCNGSGWYRAALTKDGKYQQGEACKITESGMSGMRAYLRNAYYQIQNDIGITSNTYRGIGDVTTDKAFSGVIAGKKASDGSKPTVYISVSGTVIGGFGGLIQYSQGSVLKDLKVSYSGGEINEDGKDKTVSASAITMSNSGVPSTSNNPFFGGVVGYCMGGDTIIDNVSVNYGSGSVTLKDPNSNGYDRMIAAGGYVGLVGGAKDIRNGYEKTGGGVVFRGNFGDEYSFPCKDSSENDVGAALEAPEVASSGTSVIPAEDKSTYFYCNPYVGRVLDGYACYDGGTAGQSTLNNTDKNYTIPDVSNNDSGLIVTKKEDNSLSVTVKSAQGLWLLSAIVNSGAGAMDSTGKYADVGNQIVDAYQVGKPRSKEADYSKIGMPVTDANEKATVLADEDCWGGVAGTDVCRVSYLVGGFTSGQSSDGAYYAAHLTGRSTTTGSGAANSTNTPVSLTFAQGIDMSSYKNGFRGIGGSYGDNKNIWKANMNQNADTLTNAYRRTLLISGISGITGADPNTQIKLAMNQHNYTVEYDSYKVGAAKEKCWLNQGAGLFVDFSYQDGCTVEKLKISGNVKVSMYSVNGSLDMIDKKDYDVGVGGFAARTANASGLVTFTNFHLSDLTLYGGTGVGGVFGFTDSSGGTKNITIKNWKADDVSISNWIMKEGAIGGLVGWHHSHGTLMIGSDDESEQSDVTKLSIKANVDGQSDGNSGNNAGGLVSASDYSTITIKRVNATGITVTATKVRDVGGLVGGYSNNNGELNITNCNLNGMNVSGTNCIYVGGVVGRTAKNTKIEKVTITGESAVAGTYDKDKDFPLGGFVGRTDSNTNIELSNCHITGSQEKLVKISKGGSNNKTGTGGFIGKSKGINTFKNCSETYVNIFAVGHDASGLVGMMEDGSTNASNIVFSNVIVATNNKDKSVGLLTGDTSNKTFNGYNILADSCKVGYNTSATIDTLSSTTLENNDEKNGLWFGRSTGTSILVAVAVYGENQPQKDVGYIDSNKSSTVKITYADYPVYKSYHPVDENEVPKSAEPWLDVNPKSAVALDNGTVMTGNGVEYIMETTKNTEEDGTETITTTRVDSIANRILNEAKTGNSDRKYWKVKDESDTEKTFSDLTDKENKSGVYVDTYRSADPKTTYQGQDFPIVVVNTNNNDEVDQQLWNFIAAMTNTDSGETAKANAARVTPITYQWDGSGCFKQQDNASLTVGSDKTIRTNGRFDNEQSQFTLLDVQYKNPTTTTENLDGDYFHLYIPVLVFKVLTITVNVDILEGTNYYSDDYTALRKIPHYATADFGEPITAYIEYNYKRSQTEWQDSLDNGENLLWHYKKTIGLLNANESGTGELPGGTKLLLLDKQNSSLYEYTMTGTENQNCFDFKNFTLVGDEDQCFNPTPICDLLDISAASKDDGSGTYVRLDLETESETDATVRDKEGTYYRPKKEDEQVETTYTLTVGEGVTTNENYLNQGDAYYLTMEVPKTSGITVINNLMGAADGSLTGVGVAPPNTILRETGNNNNSRLYNDRYFFYEFLNQSELTVESKRLRNGIEQPTTEMKQGDLIQITLSTDLSLTEEGKRNYLYKPRSMYQQFAIDLKKYDADNPSGISTSIGADSASWTYQVLDGNQPKFTASGRQSGLQNLSTLTISYGGTENSTGTENLYLPKLLYDKAGGIADGELANNPLTVKLVITLEYSNVNGFPTRTGTDTSSYGLTAHGISRIANQDSQLPITTKTTAADDKDNKRYYTSELSYVTLHYNAIQQGIGASVSREDTNAQLGINPSDESGNYLPVYTQGYFDYSQVVAADLARAKKIRYTVELLQKDNTGGYTISVPISGDTGSWSEGYNVQVDNESATLTVIDGAKYIYNYICNLPTDGNGEKYSGSSFRMDFTPLTGTEFEKRELTYSNYKVLLTAVLLDEKETPISGTEASDYIIYTNARVYQGLLQ